MAQSNNSETSQDYLRLQRVMDVIGNKPGSILVRGPDVWIALEPGNEGDILVINDGGMPEWMSYSEWDERYG